MNLPTRLIILAGIGLFLAGCAGPAPKNTGTAKPVATRSHGGGYYLDDGPGDNPPADLASIPDAVPKVEPLKAAANRPYSAMGKEYVPLADARGFKERGLASWYGRRYNGKATSSGETYDMYAMTAAHPTLPIPSYARVTNLANGRSVVVRINDRGPFHDGRVIDLSYTAAWKLDILKGVTPVEVDAIDPAVPVPDNVATVEPIPTATQAKVEETALTPLEPVATPATASATPATGTYLQLGAFATSDSAGQVARRVEERVGATLPAIHTVKAGSVVKVQMGPFASLAQADQAARLVEQETGIHPFKVIR